MAAWVEVRARRPNASLVVLGCSPSAAPSAGCAAAAAHANASVGGGGVWLAGELWGDALASTLRSCSLDLVPVARPAHVQLGALLRAQAAGAVPVSSRHLDSVLPVGSGRWDLGPPPSHTAAALDGGSGDSLVSSWVDCVVAASGRKLTRHRAAMVSWAAEQGGFPSDRHGSHSLRVGGSHRPVPFGRPGGDH